MFSLKNLPQIVYQRVQQCQSCLRKASKQALQPLRIAKNRKMEAWQIHSYGGIDELQLTSARIPHMTNADDLLIHVKAASLNPIDHMMMGGYGRSALGCLRESEMEFPLTLGREFAGTVVDKGRTVGNDFKIGDNVYGIIPFHKQGSHAEYIVADKSQTLLQPAFLTATEASSLLFASLTAWASLFITGELALRDPSCVKILILGVSSSVGCAATQILKSQNSLVVGTCATDAVPLVESLGVDNAYDYTNSNHVRAIASHGTYDIILDCAKFGHKNIPAEWKYKKYITLNSPLVRNLDKFGLVGGAVASMSDIAVANLEKLAIGKSVRWGFFMPFSSGLDFIGKLVNNKQLLPVIHKTFKFEEVPEAYKMLTSGHLRGKIVIDMQ